MEKMRVGIVGLGNRGKGLLKLLLKMDDLQVVAVSDLYEDRVEAGLALVQEARGETAQGTKDYRQLLEKFQLQALVVATSWTSHSEIAIAAMKAGIPVCTEVGGAASLEECWELVRVAEETGTPCMFLENCCYGREEMALLHMVREGHFGDLLHCQAGYQHDIREEVATGLDRRHYRFRNYVHRNGDVYPTHGLGPLAKILDINRGNRFTSLVSMASPSRGVKLWAQEHLGPDHPASVADYALGDIVTTMIKCMRGETIVLVHDTSLPRPYSRAGRVQGTKGIWMEDNASIHLEGRSPDHQWEPFSEYMEKYEHPLWKSYLSEGVREGHGGMDHLVLRAFLESVQAGEEMPIDIYDMVTWMSITALSEQSIHLGSAPVAVPDFTNGKWINRQLNNTTRYAL